MQKISIAEAKKLDIVDFLQRHGYSPSKIRNDDYWYLSPLRDETAASFKVNRRLNVWFDHGTGEGGSVIDLAMKILNCSLLEFLHQLPILTDTSVIPTPLTMITGSVQKIENQIGKISILNISNLSDRCLLKYLNSRKIPLLIANKFCEQVSFKLYNKVHTAIGFKNNLGGYELRNAYFKGSSSPKESTLIHTSEKELAVFEGFFSFLSFESLKANEHWNSIPMSMPQTATLTLNSLSFLKKNREIMESFSSIHLFLDQDLPGRMATKTALGWSSKFIDQSWCYKNSKDLNDYLTIQKSDHLKRNKI